VRPAAITVDDVAKRFRLEHDRSSSIKGAVLRGFRRGSVEEFWALGGVSFDIPQGSTFALVGRNGSGKSTLLKCMARILRPDRGTISIDGRMSALLELGAGFHPELSGRENVYLNASILGLSAQEVRARFDDIVGFAGLERFIDTPVKNYSSGMYVRLGFSVAINVDPDVLLVDEVLAVGDEQFQQRCLAKFRDLTRAGRTVVVVTHAMSLVRTLCDEAVWLDRGQLRLAGTSRDVVDGYLDDVRRARTEEGDVEADGSGPVTELAVVDDSGAARRDVETGQPLRLRIGYRPPSHPRPLALVLDLRRSDGIQITRAQLGPTDAPTDRPMTLTYIVDEMRLVPADYSVAASVIDADSGKLVEAGTPIATFTVPAAPEAARFGVLDLAGRWEVDDGHPGRRQ
jgi:ABC-type polysaccharide/polyol phosphate transport system ATPase subunit